MTVNKYGVRVGDIYATSWGYDQTNVNYYHVVRVTAARAEIVPIGAAIIISSDGSGSDYLVPNPEHVREYDVLIGVNRGDERRSKLCATKVGYQGKPCIVLRSGQYWAYPWDGRADRATSSGWGH